MDISCNDGDLLCFQEAALLFFLQNIFSSDLAWLAVMLHKAARMQWPAAAGGAPSSTGKNPLQTAQHTIHSVYTRGRGRARRHAHPEQKQPHAPHPSVNSQLPGSRQGPQGARGSSRGSVHKRASPQSLSTFSSSLLPSVPRP
jgi:hypothetical protein